MRRPAKTCLLLVLLCLAAIPATLAQENQHRTTAPRPLTRREGLTILRVALDSRHHARSFDCSHLVHALYDRAGFPYDYAPSSDLYVGIEDFRRVAHPQPGDLAVWPGHAGIVVNAAQHSFFSMLSSGPGVDFYDSPYWKQRGRPRFFRYLETAPTGVLSSSLRGPRP
jgi:cell wall-associated NlpC family hydrolase